MIRRFAYVSLLVSAAGPVMAQQVVSTGSQSTASESQSASPDIVVTALKRGETALKTPASITILSHDALAAQNVTSANQFTGIVPGLVMMVGTGGLPATTFRGLGSNSSVFGMEASVAEYIDGVYLGHLRDYLTPLYDIDHVEFIKGTQSTLLAKNTSLGAISIVNHRPTKRFGFDLSLTHSFDINGNRAEGAINVPIGDKLQARAAFIANHEDGFGYNQYNGKDTQRLRDLSGRLSLAFQPTETLSGTLIYQHDDHHTSGENIEVVTDPSGTVAGRVTAAGLPPLNVVPDGVTGQGSLTAGGGVAGVYPRDNQISNRLNLIVDKELGNYTLTSQTAYIRWNVDRINDLDATPLNLFNIHDLEHNKVFSQELRLQSPTSARFSYLVGAYYYYNLWGLDRTYYGSPSNTVGFPLGGATSGSFREPTHAVSGFASATFAITPALQVQGGLRYTREKKEGSFVRAGSGSIATAFQDVPFTNYPSKTSHPLDYNFGLSYNVTSRVLLYGSYAKGSKSGGYQEFPTTAAGAPFSGEAAYSAEIGAKARLDIGYLTAAIYNTRVKGFQTNYTSSVGNPAVNQSVVGNADIRSRGFELNAGYTGIRRLTVAGSLVYADAIFTSNFPAVGSKVGFSGDRLTRAPKWTGKLSADYIAPLTSRFEGFVGGSVNVTSRFLLQYLAIRPDAPAAVGHHIVDARIGVRDTKGGWELSVLGTNLTNARYVDFDSPISASGNGLFRQAYYGSINRPRVIALRLTVHQ